MLALAAAAVVAFVPRFALTGSMLNYETTLAFFSALFLWALLRIGSQGNSVASSAEEQDAEIRNTDYEMPVGYATRSAYHASRTTQYVIVTGLFAGRRPSPPNSVP